MAEHRFADFYRVEGDQIEARFLSRVEADTLYVDLRVAGDMGLTGDRETGFEFNAYLRLNRFPLGRVRVTPLDPAEVPEHVRRRSQPARQSHSTERAWPGTAASGP